MTTTTEEFRRWLIPRINRRWPDIAEIIRVQPLLTGNPALIYYLRNSHTKSDKVDWKKEGF